MVSCDLLTSGVLLIAAVATKWAEQVRSHSEYFIRIRLSTMHSLLDWIWHSDSGCFSTSQCWRPQIATANLGKIRHESLSNGKVGLFVNYKIFSLKYLKLIILKKTTLLGLLWPLERHCNIIKISYSKRQKTTNSTWDQGSWSRSSWIPFQNYVCFHMKNPRNSPHLTLTKP